MRIPMLQRALAILVFGVPAVTQAQAAARRGAVSVTVIGRLPSTEAAAALRDIGDSASAMAVQAAVDRAGQDVQFSALALAVPKPYQYTSHVFGYIAPGASAGSVVVTDAGAIDPDLTLKSATRKITLDRLRVYDYPGSGTHMVLFDFFADHQATDTQKEELHFNQTYRVSEGGGAGVIGYPVFIGLRAGPEGVAFQCSTVNVENVGDQQFLGFLNGDVFKGGLRLINAVNPVVPVISQLAKGLAESVASRHQNVPVQDFYMGLDFSTNRTRAKLRQGSYVAVQVADPAAWDWSQWEFNVASGQLVSKSNPTIGIPYNYIVFSISRIQAP